MNRIVAKVPASLRWIIFHKVLDPDPGAEKSPNLFSSSLHRCLYQCLNYGAHCCWIVTCSARTDRHRDKQTNATDQHARWNVHLMKSRLAIKRLQYTAARLASGTRRHDYITSILRGLRRLPVRRRIVLQDCNPCVEMYQWRRSSVSTGTLRGLGRSPLRSEYVCVRATSACRH